MSKVFTKLVLLLAVVCITTVAVEAAPGGKSSKLSSNSVGRSPAASSNTFRGNSANNLSRNSVSQAKIQSKPAISNSLSNATNLAKVPGTINRPNLGNANLALQKPGKLTMPGSKLPLGKKPAGLDLADLKPLKNPHKLPDLQLPGTGLKPQFPVAPFCGTINPPHPCPPGPWGGCGNWGWGCNLPWFNCGHYYPLPCYTPCYTPWISYCPTLTTSTVLVESPVVVTSVEAAPVAAAPATVDLVVEQVVMLEAGDAAKNEGPLVRVVVLNQGTADAGKFALGLYASLKNEPNAEMVPAGKELTQLAAGARETIEVRLPVQALAMTEQGKNEPQSFKMLFVVADVQNEVTEADKKNNLLPITLADLLAKAAR